jgi:hypothetical protein
MKSEDALPFLPYRIYNTVNIVLIILSPNRAKIIKTRRGTYAFYEFYPQSSSLEVREISSVQTTAQACFPNSLVSLGITSLVLIAGPAVHHWITDSSPDNFNERQTRALLRGQR